MKVRKVLPLAQSRAGFCFAAALTFWMFATGSAQIAKAQTLSSINGTVTDSSGAVISNAKVTVKNDDDSNLERGRDEFRRNIYRHGSDSG